MRLSICERNYASPGWITTEGLKQAAKAYGKSVYGQHLKKVADGEIVNSPREY